MKIGMKLLILLLNSVLLFRDAITILIDVDVERDYNLAVENRLSYNIIPLHYEINLELHAMHRDISSHGECKIYIRINSPTTNISFHVDLSQIYDLHLHILETDDIRKMKPYHPIQYIYYNENNILALFFSDKILPGYYTLEMTFMYTENSNIGGLFRTTFINDEGDKEWLVAIDFLPIGARRMFPCWDEPGFLATFNISIKYEKNYTILSNAPSINITDGPNMMKTAHFMTRVIPTYRISAILLSNFSSYAMGDIYIEYRRQLQFYYFEWARNVIDKIIQHFKWKGYLEDTINLVVIPSFRHDTVSNLGLIYYRETAILFDDEKDPFIRRLEIAHLIGRTIAYQCFKNQINASWWSYMWLIEGITTLLGMDAIDKAFPSLRIKDLFVVQTQQESLRFDNNFVMKPLVSEVKSSSDIESIFSMSYYMKAPAILRMLRHMLTDDVFLKGIHKYLMSAKFSLDKTTIIDDFWTAMQYSYETYEHRVQHLNIKEIMDAWTQQQHYPMVKVMQNGTLVRVIENMNTNEKNWWIPYTTATNAKPDFSLSNLQVDIHFSTAEDKFLKLGENEWLIVNVQQIGYYRVNYDDTCYEKIASYLISDEYNKIHVLNRAQIIDDAFYFLMRNELDLSTFFGLTRYLEQEIDFIAWYPMIKAFEYMSPLFPFPQSTYIKENMIKILNKLLEKIKYEKSVESDDILREEAAKWACILGSSKCKRKANSKLRTHLKELRGDLSLWKEWTYCNGLMIADNITWDLAFNIYIEEPEYTGFKFLACSENFFIIRNYIELIASEPYNEKIKEYDRIHIFHSVVARHAKSNTMLDYLLENFDKLKPREISATVALIDIINHVYSKEQLDKIIYFVYNYLAWPANLLFIHPLFDYKLYKQIKPCVTSDFSELIILAKILLIKHKTELRLSQIMLQKNNIQHIYEHIYYQS